MTAIMPHIVELCQRPREGRPCLGRIHRSGSPEMIVCTLCGAHEPGARYALVVESLTYGEAEP
jgi:hypothetical protein